MSETMKGFFHRDVYYQYVIRIKSVKFAFLIMGDFTPAEDHAEIHNGMAKLIGVSNISQACSVARSLKEQGIDCIELCGAFGAFGAQDVIDATDHTIPVGYVTHLPQQDALYKTVFSE